jgi:hypothetical protein
MKKLTAAKIQTALARRFPQSAEQLLEELFTIFPEYRARYDNPIHDDTLTFHSVLMAFRFAFLSKYAQMIFPKPL